MKALFAGALCAAVVTTAHAQSAVTLYGMLDVALPRCRTTAVIARR
ncbi:hypothetical protein [Burkholderia gladioli]